MAELEGLTALRARLDKLLAKYGSGQPSVRVGYTAEYAVYVHEDLEAQHPHGQAKFLEEPSRSLAPVIGGIIAQALVTGKTPAQAVLLGGLFLQAESQKLCPVDTGNLKGSAYTELTTPT